MAKIKAEIFADILEYLKVVVTEISQTEETGDGSSGIQFYNLKSKKFGSVEIQIKDGKLFGFFVYSPTLLEQMKPSREVQDTWNT